MKVNLFFVLCLCALISSCKKTNNDPVIFPPDKYPTITFDKTKIKSAYAIGDTVNLLINIKDNGYGSIKAFYSRLEKNEKCTVPVGTSYSCSAEGVTNIDSIIVNPPSVLINYNFKWIVKQFGNNFKSGDSVFIFIDARYLNKPSSAEYYSMKKINAPVFKIK